MTWKWFSSPIGESTFSTEEIKTVLKEKCEFSSPIGESTFSTVFSVHFTTPLHGFRPLSGNLLSLPEVMSIITPEKQVVFVPYRGIYFLYLRKTVNRKRFTLFSSPIGESTFSTVIPLCRSVIQCVVFVPYRGIYFLYGSSECCRKWLFRFRPLSGNLLSLPLPLEPLCLSGFRSCFAGQNLKIVFLFLFLMLAPLFPLFYAVRRKILFTAGKTLFFPFPYHIIFLDISCICIHAVQLQGLRPLHVYAVHTL